MADILIDSKGNGIPQYQASTGEFRPLLGDKAPYSQIVDAQGNVLFSATNPGYIRLKGNDIKEAWEGSATVVRNLSVTGRAFLISNDGAEDLTFTINSVTIRVKQNEVFEGSFEDFTQVTITTNVSYRAIVKG